MKSFLKKLFSSSPTTYQDVARQLTNHLWKAYEHVVKRLGPNAKQDEALVSVTAMALWAIDQSEVDARESLQTALREQFVHLVVSGAIARHIIQDDDSFYDLLNRRAEEYYTICESEWQVSKSGGSGLRYLGAIILNYGGLPQTSSRCEEGPFPLFLRSYAKEIYLKTEKWVSSVPLESPL